MWSRELLGTDVYHLIHWFFVYSILGWFVESVYMSFCNKKITNRGFIKGPICPIYGMGALGAYFVLREFAGNFVLLFFLGSLLATTLEYITARIMLYLFGEFWWDYTDKPFNYKGILCLESSIAWGFYTIGLFLFLHRLVVRIVSSHSFQAGKVVGGVVLIYFLVDFTYHLYREKEVSISKSFTEVKSVFRSLYKN